MPVDGLDEDDSPELLDASARTALDHTTFQVERAETLRKPDSPDHDADGGWRWKGLELSPQANRVAEAGLALRRAAEGRDADGNYSDHGITPEMRRIEAELEHGSLVPDTEKFALKSPDRFKEKLAKMIERFPDRSPEELAGSIHDGIRFTFLLESDSYTEGVERIGENLSDRGYELQVLKSTWEGSDYKGVNTRWRDNESGVLFEVQMHTYESWHAKQATHDIYEMLQDARTHPHERVRLEDEQRKMMRAVPVPDGALDIKPYRREGTS